MPKLLFKADNLMTLDDGRLALAIDADVRQILGDLHDRPGDKTPRKLNIGISFRPYMEGNEFAGAKIDWTTKPVIPKRQSRSIDAVADGDDLLFNSAAPENARQTTIHDFPNFNEGTN